MVWQSLQLTIRYELDMLDEEDRMLEEADAGAPEQIGAWGWENQAGHRGRSWASRLLGTLSWPTAADAQMMSYTARHRLHLSPHILYLRQPSLHQMDDPAVLAVRMV